MKTSAITLLVVLLLSACVQPPQASAPIRISDRYSREAVKSYEVFEAGMDGYVIILVRLATGERFPMLCREAKSGFYPIPQSVFATGAERWSIMCEPYVRDVHTLRRLELWTEEGDLLMSGGKLKRSAQAELLASSPL